MENIKIIEDKFKNKIVLSRNGKIKIIDENITKERLTLVQNKLFNNQKEMNKSM